MAIHLFSLNSFTTMKSHSRFLLCTISLILVFLVKISDQKHKVYYFSNVNINFNPKFGKFSTDMSPWKNNTKTNPNLKFGNIKVWSNKDFSNLLVSFKIIFLSNID